MADSKLLDLPAASTLNGTESVYIVQAGVDKRSSTALMTSTAVVAPMSLDTQVLYNRGGIIDGADGLTYDNVTNRTDVNGTARVIGASANPATGAGIEMFYSGSVSGGYFQVFDRGASTFRPVNIQGSNVAFSTNGTSTTTPSMVITNNLVGINTIPATPPTHSLTLGSTATGITAYQTADQTVNYQRYRQYWNGTTYVMGTDFAGTGTATILQMGIAATAGTAPNRTLNVQGSMPFFSYTWGGTGLGGVQGAVDIGSGNTFSGSAVNQIALSITPTIAQTSTASYTALSISPFENTTGSGTKYLINAGTSSAASGGGTFTSKFSLDSTGNTIQTGRISNVLTTEQMRLGYDASNFATFTVSSTGGLTINSQAGVTVATGFGFGFNGSSLWLGSSQGNLTPNIASLSLKGSNNVNAKVTSNANVATAPGVNFSFANYLIGAMGSGINVAASGTHPLYANLAIKPLTINAGTATVTQSASLYVEGAATGATNNFSVLVDSTNIPFSIDSGGVVTGQSTQLFRITGLNAVTTANTLAYTNNTGKSIVINQVGVVCTAATAITVGPAIGIGTASGTNDIFGSVAMNALTSPSRAHGLVANGGLAVVPNGGTVYINLTAATGTSQTISLAFMGFAF